MSATKGSAVLNVFGEGEDSSICKACGKHVKRTVGNTLTFKAHLKIHHPAEHQQLLQLEMKRKEEVLRETETLKRKQPTLQATFQRATPYDHQNPRVDSLNALLICLFTLEALPFRLL